MNGLVAVDIVYKSNHFNGIPGIMNVYGASPPKKKNHIRHEKSRVNSSRCIKLVDKKDLKIMDIRHKMISAANLPNILYIYIM